MSGDVFLDIFGGTGGVAHAVSRHGVVAVVIDLASGHDVLKPAIQQALKGLLRQKRRGRNVVRGVCLASPCETFSTARRAPLYARFPHQLRSREHPFGLPLLTGNDLEICMRGNQLAAFTAMIIRLCNKLRIPWMLENPASSYLWSHPPMQSALRGCTDTVIDQCQYGMAWRKPTRMAMGGLLCPTPYLCKRCAGSRQRCSATGKAHVVLSGTANGAFRTAVSKHYPKALCRGIAYTFRSLWASRYVADHAEIFVR